MPVKATRAKRATRSKHATPPTETELAASDKILETAIAAAAEAKHTLDVAKEAAAKIIADAAAPISAALEHRLTLIESTQADLGRTMQAQHDGVILAVGDVKNVVLKQNGRVGRLETWKTQQTAIYALLLAIAPFTFWGLTKWFGG